MFINFKYKYLYLTIYLTNIFFYNLFIFKKYMVRRTKPKLWKKIKKKVMAEEKGGPAGKWSARKAQLAVKQYKQQGGDYIDNISKKHNDLSVWTDQEWGYYNSYWKKKGGRYLPKKLWKSLTPRQIKITNQNKVKCGDKKKCPYEDFILKKFEKIKE